MYPITSAVKALFEAEQRQVLRITGTDKNGVDITITDADVVMGGFNIDRYSCNGEKLEIGTAIAAEMTLKLDNRQGQFNGVVFEGTELFVEIGIADWSQEEPEVFYMPCGYFTPDEQPRSLSTITIHALDRMVKFDVPTTLNVPWTDNNGNTITDSNGETIYFNSQLLFPTTVTHLIEQICTYLNIPFNQSLSGKPNANYVLNGLPELQQEITMRSIISWCAGMMGTNAWIDWNGYLHFSWYNNSTNYITTPANRFSSDLYENDITITGVQYLNLQGVTLIAGNSDYAIDMTGNYLIESGAAQIIPNINNVINGFSYRPFFAKTINAPYLWPMDVISFSDKNGNSYDCIITNVNFGLNSTTSIQGKGETTQINEGLKQNDRAYLIEKAAENVKELDASLDQTAIFNRLTNNGQAQGVYMIDGQLYINMSYARAGTLVLGGLNNQNGLLQVMNADNELVGEWNNKGVIIRNGNIMLPYDNNNGKGEVYVGYFTTPFRVEHEEYETGEKHSTYIYGTSIELHNKTHGNYLMLYFNRIYIRRVNEDGQGIPRFILRDEPYGVEVDVQANTGLTTYKKDAQGSWNERSKFGIENTVITGNLTVNGDITTDNGAIGTFTSADGKTVVVQKGIITSIT